MRPTVYIERAGSLRRSVSKVAFSFAVQHGLVKFHNVALVVYCRLDDAVPDAVKLIVLVERDRRATPGRPNGRC